MQAFSSGLCGRRRTGKARQGGPILRRGLVSSGLVSVVCLLGPTAIAMAQSTDVDPRLLGDEKVLLWPSAPPGWVTDQPEVDTTDDSQGRQVAGRRVMRLGHVSQPMITLFRANRDSGDGPAVIVCPGGGYHILAYDLEGTEVCQWLQSIGVHAVLLKYRVPRPPGSDRPVEPLMDAQRAISLVRNNAAEWGIDPQRIGILGFSAGGNLAARAATNYAKRVYPAVDAVDTVPCRPDFAVLVYPAYLYDKNDPGCERWVAPDLPVDANTPPMFLTMAFDDRVGPENILRMGLALKQANVPCEIHLYPSGGHGYGLRRTDQPVTTWPDRCREWMQASGWLTTR
ncbi:MAG: alpha/beta hydrolase [Planctomycetota bacterium]|nr:MAG: alpha/beta hydrolase [Planctomycetota bacterium]